MPATRKIHFHAYGPADTVGTAQTTGCGLAGAHEYSVTKKPELVTCRTCVTSLRQRGMLPAGIPDPRPWKCLDCFDRFVHAQTSGRHRTVFRPRNIVKAAASRG